MTSSHKKPLAEVLKLALKIVSESEGVAPKLLASSADIDAIATSDEANVPALKDHWRRTVFGDIALALKSGKATIGLEKGRARIFV